MTDRHAGYIVTLGKDTREDDAEYIVNAIRMIKGVADVSPIVADYGLHIAGVRRDQAWQDTLRQVTRNGPGPFAWEQQ